MEVSVVQLESSDVQHDVEIEIAELSDGAVPCDDIVEVKEKNDGRMLDEDVNGIDETGLEGQEYMNDVFTTPVLSDVILDEDRLDKDVSEFLVLDGELFELEGELDPEDVASVPEEEKTVVK